MTRSYPNPNRTTRRVPRLILSLAAALLASSCATQTSDTTPTPLPAMRPDFSSIETTLKAAIKDRAFPGCAVAVGTERGILWRDAFGYQTYEGKRPVTTDTIYDLASLSKVTGTTALLMKLAADGKLHETDPLSKFIPEFIAAATTDEERTRRESVTLEHVMTHSSGLASWKAFYKTCDTYPKLLKAIVNTPMEAAPGERYKYSDLGFILLGEVAARAGGKSAPRLEQELIFKPLGMRDTMRNPPSRMKLRIAPTEKDPAGKGFLHGVVHDENCRFAGGVTGHAGLFSTVGDLSRYAGELLNARDGKGRVFTRDVVTEFTRRQGMTGSNRGQGWQKPSGGNSAGAIFSRTSFGHTGYTGTSIWIDPERKLFVILLTNRVHPTRKNSRISAVRRTVADAAAKAFDAWRAPHS
jgi:CubicO group peptidase (beta-lactamase class C family)